jgi:hypothetical protein
MQIGRRFMYDHGLEIADIGPHTGADRYRRLVQLVKVAPEITDRVDRTRGLDSPEWLAFHPMPSPFPDENSAYHCLPVFLEVEGVNCVSVFTNIDVRSRFRHNGGRRLFIDAKVEVYAQVMEKEFGAIIKGDPRPVRGERGQWLVQFYEPGRETSPGFIAMQFVVTSSSFMNAYFVHDPVGA